MTIRVFVSLSLSAALLLPPSAPGSAQQALREWSLVSELRIGTLDGPTALGTVGPVIVSPATGTVFVAEQSQRIFVFAPDGSSRGTIGGRGEGPGEFQNLTDLYWSEGFVVAIDGATRRVTRFTEAGEVVDSRLIQVVRPLAPLAGGAFLAQSYDQSEVHGVLTTESLLLRLDRSGGESVLDRMAHQGTWMPTSDGRLLFPIPMVPRSLHGVHPHGATIAIVHQYAPPTAEAGGFRVRKLASNGTLIFARNYGYTPRPLPVTYVRDFVEGRRSVLEPRGISLREVERLIANRVPRFEPPVSEVRMGTDGSIWLKRETHEADPALWWVLDDRGDLVGQLRLPRRLQIRHIDRDIVWGVAFDEMDVNYIVKYRIAR